VNQSFERTLKAKQTSNENKHKRTTLYIAHAHLFLTIVYIIEVNSKKLYLSKLGINHQRKNDVQMDII
jgi:hypothetical protein